VYRSVCASVVIKILQGSIVNGSYVGLLYIFQLQISSTAYTPKITNVGWQ